MPPYIGRREGEFCPPGPIPLLMPPGNSVIGTENLLLFFLQLFHLTVLFFHYQQLVSGVGHQYWSNYRSWLNMVVGGGTNIMAGQVLIVKNNTKQTGTELGQAQLKLGFDFTLIFCRFGFFRCVSIKLVWWISFFRFD